MRIEHFERISLILALGWLRRGYTTRLFFFARDETKSVLLGLWPTRYAK
jgi:hypothetical protein